MISVTLLRLCLKNDLACLLGMFLAVVMTAISNCFSWEGGYSPCGAKNAIKKRLRKNKIMAEAYTNVFNPEKKEHINYLTNSFTSGGLPVLVTTQEAGKNLSNPHIRFIVHYDVPADEELYKLHVAQIGQLASDAVVHDLCLL